MIATKTTALMVAMAVIGIVPVAAHAQTVDIAELLEQSGSAEQISAPSQDQGAANVDEDHNTPTNVIFATVGPNGTVSGVQTNTIEDADVLANSQTETQSGDATQVPSQTQSSTQIPTLTVGEVLGLLPATG